MERANLFLLPLDEVRGWWRYHHLFADLLRARLVREQSERLLELHRAAAAWCEQHGLMDDAVRHALAAGDTLWAARLIEQHFDAMLWRSEDVTFRRWLQALPAELVRFRPRLCLAQTYSALLSGRLEAVEPLVADAQQAVAAVAEEPYEPSAGRAASLLANLPAAITLAPAMLARDRGDAERTAEFAQQALTHLTDADHTLRHFARYYLAMADWLRGRLPEAEQALASLAAEQVAAGARYLAPLYHDLGQVQRARGHLGAALRTYERALGIATQAGRPLPPAGIPHVDIAEVLYERGALAALDHATQGVALSRQLGWARQLAASLAILAWIRHAQSDRVGALEAVDEAERVGVSPAMVGLLNPLPALRARLALAHGEVGEAARWVQECGIDANDEPNYPREREYLVLVRVQLAQQAPEQALGLLRRLHTLAAAQGRTGSVIEARALQALALHAGGDQAGALDALAEALTLGAPEGYLRVFVDEGPPMATLLHQLLAGQRRERLAAAGAVPREYLARLVDAFEQAGLPVRAPAGRGAVVAGLVEPLTARELEVLGLLAAGAPNRAIAEQLVVTPETVKKHLSHLFDKLGVANRTQAVARARQLGLLP
jgi:LuxR family maltose regulon positive regulatory protein